MLATGYMVKSLAVIALRNVLSDPFANTSNGLLTGKFLEPFNTECSMMWGVPQSVFGVVLKAMQNVLLTSSAAILSSRAPLFTCSK